MSSPAVRQNYRQLARLIARLPRDQQAKSLVELREKFRQPLGEDDSLDERLKLAQDRISFLRIVTPKDVHTKASGTFIYKGGKVKSGSATERLKGDGVVKTFDPMNLDRDHVKRHNASLKRAGFVNNLHAKGIF